MLGSPIGGREVIMLPEVVVVTSVGELSDEFMPGALPKPSLLGGTKLADGCVVAEGVLLLTCNRGSVTSVGEPLVEFFVANAFGATLDDSCDSSFIVPGGFFLCFLWISSATLSCLIKCVHPSILSQEKM